MNPRPNAVVCAGAVVRRGNRILLIRQGPGHALEGQWTVPWGFVDEGESPAAAALRETLEETGVHAKVEGLLGIQDLPESGWMGIVFLCRYQSGDPEPDREEVDRAGFFAAADLDGLHGSVEPWSEWVVRRVMARRHSVLSQAPGNPYTPRAGFF